MTRQAEHVNNLITTLWPGKQELDFGKGPNIYRIWIYWPLPVCVRDARQTNKGRFSISSGCFFPMSMCGWIGRDTWILTSSVCVGSAYFMHERKTSPAYLIGTKGTAKPVYLPAWRSGKNGVNKIAWLPRRLELWSLHLHLWDQIRSDDGSRRGASTTL